MEIRDFFTPSAIQVVVFDLDLTLYPADASYFKACAEAVDTLETGFNFQAIKNKWDLKRAIKQHGLHRLSETFDGMADMARRRLSPDFMRPDNQMTQLFESLSSTGKNPITFCIMSQSEMTWVNPSLLRLGISNLIAPENRFTPETCFGLDKKSPYAYNILKTKFPGLPAQAFLLVDDSRQNIRAADEAGLQTAWVRNIETDKAPARAGLVVRSAADVIEHLAYNR